jgi:hypothetical protein
MTNPFFVALHRLDYRCDVVSTFGIPASMSPGMPLNVTKPQPARTESTGVFHCVQALAHRPHKTLADVAVLLPSSESSIFLYSMATTE